MRVIGGARLDWGWQPHDAEAAGRTGVGEGHTTVEAG